MGLGNVTVMLRSGVVWDCDGGVGVFFFDETVVF